MNAAPWWQKSHNVYYGKYARASPFPLPPRSRRSGLDRHPVERAREMAVSRMRRATVAVDDPGVDALERRKGRLVQAHDVGRIRERAEPEAQGRAEAMVLSERHDPHPRDLERALDRRRDQGWLVEDGAGGGIRGPEDI